MLNALRNPTPLFRPTVLFLLAVLVAVLAIGCAAKPESAEDYVQASKAQLASGYRSLGDLKAAGLVTQDEGKRYFARLEEAELGMRASEKSLAGGQLSTAQGQAKAASSLLLAIDGELRNRLATKKGS